MTIRRALISVSDKRGVLTFAQALASAGVELLSTGGTARTLRDGGLDVTDVADVTGFPEIMDGRVKTLHPAIHGALLRRPGVDDATLETHSITPIDLLVVNLYPFAETINQADVSIEAAIEQIDIGGPAMLRAAAKIMHPSPWWSTRTTMNPSGHWAASARRRMPHYGDDSLHWRLHIRPRMTAPSPIT